MLINIVTITGIMTNSFVFHRPLKSVMTNSVLVGFPLLHVQFRRVIMANLHHTSWNSKQLHVYHLDNIKLMTPHCSYALTFSKHLLNYGH